MKGLKWCLAASCHAVCDLPVKLAMKTQGKLTAAVELRHTVSVPSGPGGVPANAGLLTPHRGMSSLADRCTRT